MHSGDKCTTPALCVHIPYTEVACFHRTGTCLTSREGTILRPEGVSLKTSKQNSLLNRSHNSSRSSITELQVNLKEKGSFVEETCKSALQKDHSWFPNWLLLLSRYQTEKSISSQPFLLHFHHRASTTRYWAHWHSANTCANISTSSAHLPTAGTERQHQATPCSTQVQSLNTTGRQSHFYKQQYLIWTSQAVVGNQRGSDVLESNKNTQLLSCCFLRCLQALTAGSRAPWAAFQWCLKAKKQQQQNQNSKSSQKLSHLNKEHDTVSLSFQVRTRRTTTHSLCAWVYDREGRYRPAKGMLQCLYLTVPLLLLCYNWMKGRLSSSATSDLQSNSNERGKGRKRTGKKTNLCHHGHLANWAPEQNLTCGHLPFCLSAPAQNSEKKVIRHTMHDRKSIKAVL